MRALLVLVALSLASLPGAAFAERKKLHPPDPPLVNPPQKRLFFGFSSGTGGGVIGGKTEAIRADVEGGLQWSPMHMRVEMVALRTPTLGFGVSARMGFPMADTDAATAKSVMLLGYYLCPCGFRYSAGVGAGYVRYRVPTDSVHTVDTMAAGPVLVGGSAGYLLPISKGWRLSADAHAIAAVAVTDRYAGVPNESALHFELDVGLVFFR